MALCYIPKDNLQIPLPDWKFDGTWVAGGAVRDSILKEKISDIDVFGKTPEALERFIDDNLAGCKIIFNSKLLKTFVDKDGNKVQVIFRTYKSPEECLESFDYTICQFAYTGDQILCNPESLIHAHRKRLVINKIVARFSIDSLRRLQKYVKKGYTICNGGLADLARAIQSLNEKEIEEQIAYYPNGTERIIRFD